jgi:type III restriction enzyme
VLVIHTDAKGVGVVSISNPPTLPVIIEPVRQRLAYDIHIPLTKPSLMHDIHRLSELDPACLEPICRQEEQAEPFRLRLILEFVTTETEAHQIGIGTAELASARDLLSSITNKVMGRAKLPNRFAELYPAVLLVTRITRWGS